MVQRPKPDHLRQALGRRALGLPGLPLAIWVTLFVGLPGAFVLVFSFMVYGWYEVGMPFTLENYASIISAAAYGKLFLKTLTISAVVTVVAIVTASPDVVEKPSSSSPMGA